MHTGFIGDPVSWKRKGLAEVGGERHGQSRVREAKVRVEGQGGKQTSVWPESRQPESQEKECFILRTYKVGRMGVKKLHID